MVKIGIVGGTGYTGSELLRILSAHPYASIEIVTSRKESGIKVRSYFKNLNISDELVFSDLNDEKLLNCDVVFFCTPHGVCMKEAKRLLDEKIKVIDLSADFRIKDPEVFQKWYKMEHLSPELLKMAVYGQPETVGREAIKQAQLIANPGCYPTTMITGLMPVLKHNLVKLDQIIIDAKSGVSGAGREAKIANLYTEINESFKAYGLDGHRHQPETEQQLSTFLSENVQITFVPHLVPMSRGIESTIYLQLKDSKVDIHELYNTTYEDEFFIEVMEKGQVPETRFVRGSNFIKMGIKQFSNGRLIISVVEDNLVKGAAGQAIQCMNIMMDLPEETGLKQIGLMP